jgi:hypothetical protein
MLTKELPAKENIHKLESIKIERAENHQDKQNKLS